MKTQFDFSVLKIEFSLSFFFFNPLVLSGGMSGCFSGVLYHINPKISAEEFLYASSSKSEEIERFLISSV